MRAALTILRRFAGIGLDRAGHLEKALSMVGGLIGLTGVILISEVHLGAAGSVGLVASMGASAVLLFAVPHGPLSQPWSVLGGHMASSIVGVACAVAIAEPLVAAPLAVALAIGVMHYLRCIHPPGGATALSAVVGGDAVHELGFQYLREACVLSDHLTPVMLNATAILLIALVFNYPFRWRRYPAGFVKSVEEPEPAVMKAERPSENAHE